MPPEIYIREKDKQDAKIRNLEQRCKAMENDNLVLRQRVAVIEDRFRPEPMPMPVDSHLHTQVDIAMKKMVEKLEEDAKNETPHISELTGTDSGTSNMVKKTRKPRKAAA